MEQHPIKETQVDKEKIVREEQMAYEELLYQIKQVQVALSDTEAWAHAWHNGESALPPFGIGGKPVRFGQDLMRLACKAHSFKALAEQKAQQ